MTCVFGKMIINVAQRAGEREGSIQYLTTVERANTIKPILIYKHRYRWGVSTEVDTDTRAHRHIQAYAEERRRGWPSSL